MKYLCIYTLRQHCRKLKNRNERNEQEIKKQNERLVEEKNEFQNELSDMKNRFFEHQCDITGKLEEKSELVHTLNVDLKKYVSQIGKYNLLYLYLGGYIYVNVHTSVLYVCILRAILIDFVQNN